MRKIKINIVATCLFVFRIPVAHAAHAASPGISDMCRAVGGIIYEQSNPPNRYIESATEQNPETRIYFPSGSVFRIAASHSERTASQRTEMRKILQFAFFAGLPVNVCASQSTSPNTVLIVEISTD